MTTTTVTVSWPHSHTCDLCGPFTCARTRCGIGPYALNHESHRLELASRAGRPRQNPGMCGTRHAFVPPRYAFDSLCTECGHIEGGNCHDVKRD